MFGFVYFVSCGIVSFGFSFKPFQKKNNHHLFRLKETNNKDDGIVSVEEEYQPTIGEHISFAIGHLTDLICKHSYVFSNITMMVS